MAVLGLPTFVICSLLLLATTSARGISNDDDSDKYYWWRHSVFYQVYPRSFFDSDGDGVGDLQGIRQKASYLEKLGIGGVWLSPIFESPMKDFGYDISNYTNIDPIFGTLEDFDDLVTEFKRRGIKIILDFVPNHSSDKHEWFEKSTRKIDPYTDYYVWVDGTPGNPPNNWISVFRGSMWEWCPIRNQYYLHQFLKEQPDLNMRNPRVQEELQDVLRFWLQRGVDGFRVDALKHMFENAELFDEPLSHNPNAVEGDWDYLDHIYTTSLPEMFPVIAGWRDVLTDFLDKDGLYRLMMVEAYDSIENQKPYYGNATHPLADLPFNFELIGNLKNNTSASEVYKLVTTVLNGVPPTKWPNWVIGNHDVSRIANRTNAGFIDAMNMMNLLLKGSPVTYYGEELGMVNTFVSWNETIDPPGINAGEERYTLFSRDPQRTPMQWDSTKFSGFTSGNTTWLPVNPNFREFNVEKEERSNRSHLGIYQRLVKLREMPAVREAEVEFPVINDAIFSFTRAIRDAPGLLVVINFGNEAQTLDLGTQSTIKRYMFPRMGLVQAASVGRDDVDTYTDLARLTVQPKQGVVIEFDPQWFDN